MYGVTVVYALKRIIVHASNEALQLWQLTCRLLTDMPDCTLRAMNLRKCRLTPAVLQHMVSLCCDHWMTWGRLRHWRAFESLSTVSPRCVCCGGRTNEHLLCFATIHNFSDVTTAQEYHQRDMHPTGGIFYVKDFRECGVINELVAEICWLNCDSNNAQFSMIVIYVLLFSSSQTQQQLQWLHSPHCPLYVLDDYCYEH